MGYDFEKERNEAIDAGERALTSLRQHVVSCSRRAIGDF